MRHLCCYRYRQLVYGAPSLPEQGQDRPTALKIKTQYIAVSSSGKRRTLAFSPTPRQKTPSYASGGVLLCFLYFLYFL